MHLAIANGMLCRAVEGHSQVSKNTSKANSVECVSGFLSRSFKAWKSTYYVAFSFVMVIFQFLCWRMMCESGATIFAIQDLRVSHKSFLSGIYRIYVVTNQPGLILYYWLRTQSIIVLYISFLSIGSLNMGMHIYLFTRF